MNLHTSSYLVDIVFQEHTYPRMGWIWKMSDLPIHVYCQDSWENKYWVHCHKICDHLLIMLFQFLLYSLASFMSEKRTEAIRKIRYWCVFDNGAYFKIYGSTKMPHILPKFVPNKIMLQEVAYHTLVHGVGEFLSIDKTLPWPPLPFYVESYSFKNSKEEHAKEEVFATFHFGE